MTPKTVVEPLDPRGRRRRLARRADGRHPRLRQPADGRCHPVGDDLVIGIHEGQNLPLRGADCSIPQLAEPGVRHEEHLCPCGARHLRRVVCRPVIGDDHLDHRRRITARRDAPQAAREAQGVVPDRDHERHHGRWRFCHCRTWAEAGARRTRICVIGVICGPAYPTALPPSRAATLWQAPR